MKRYKGYEYEYRGTVRLSSERLEAIYAAVEAAIDRTVEGRGLIDSLFERLPMSVLDRLVVRRVLEVES